MFKSKIIKILSKAKVFEELTEEELKTISKAYFDQILTDNQTAKTIYRNMLRILIKRLRKKESELDLALLAS